MTNPKVSIGLPVFNGERYLEEAIESVLNQTYTNFELIIVDNASTDSTREISNTYLTKDKRIRYFRNEQNLGAAPNFNLSFHMARGKYFEWLAHDDMIAPGFLEKSVSVLDNNLATVLCFSGVKIIDEFGLQIGTHDLTLNVDAPQPWKRFHDILLDWHKSYYIFGLIRSSTLLKTKLILPFAHGDTILLSRLSLLGQFWQIPEHLFVSREHSSQSNQIYVDYSKPRYLNLAEYTNWFNNQSEEQIKYPYLKIISEYYKTLRNIKLQWRDILGCHLSLAHFVARYRQGVLYDLRKGLVYIPKKLQSFFRPVRSNNEMGF